MEFSVEFDLSEVAWNCAELPDLVRKIAEKPTFHVRVV